MSIEQNDNSNSELVVFSHPYPQVNGRLFVFCELCGSMVPWSDDFRYQVKHEAWHKDLASTKEALELTVEATTKLASIVEGVNENTRKLFDIVKELLPSGTKKRFRWSNV